MKKTITGVFLLLLCIACGAGAYAMLQYATVEQLKLRKPELEVTDITIWEGESLPESVWKVRTRNIEKISVEVNEVKAWIAGVYPVTYTYTDVEGNTHKKTVHCRVLANEGPKEEKNEAIIQHREQAEVRTSDEGKILFLVNGMLLSLGVMVLCLICKENHRKI